MIVKIQQSLATSEGETQMLVYNEDRSYEFERPLTEWARQVLKGRPKAYFEMEVVPGGFRLLGEVEPQPW